MAGVPSKPTKVQRSSVEWVGVQQVQVIFHTCTSSSVIFNIFSLIIGTCFQQNTNFNTNNIWKNGKEYLPNIPDIQRCQKECQKEWYCHIFTYQVEGKRCYLKYSLKDGKNHNVPGSISGWQSCKKI